MVHKGSCHCGKIAFEVDAELTAAVVCNCSNCARKGALLWAVPRGKLRLLGPDEGIGRYIFNKQAIEHRFCLTCGMHPFAEDADPQGERTAYVNVRCLEEVDPASTQTFDFAGRSV